MPWPVACNPSPGLIKKVTGAPVSTIAAHGRWAPGSPVVLSYIRAVDRWRDNALTGIGL
jgi:hypothetical protein